MTKEAKIGMLTGLGVIVLIGVLLSEYLGDKNTAVASGPTGRMAPLPVGAAYRDQVTSPVGVPGMAQAGQTVQMAGGSVISTPITMSNGTGGTMPPTMVAADSTDGAGAPTGPVVPVAPIEAGPMVADSRTDGPPVISLRDAVPVKLTETPKPAPVTHTIVAGDTLAKIAKQYYNSAKNSDVQKIVAANPGILKDAGTMLVVNKKLVIPGVAPAVAPVAPVVTLPRTTQAPVKVASGGGPDGVMVYLPSSSMKDAVPPSMTSVVQPPKKADAPKVDAKDPVAAKKSGTYVVQSGDTLEKIARKLAPAKSPAMVQKLISMNGIKDPTRLQVGVTIKVPV